MSENVAGAPPASLLLQPISNGKIDSPLGGHIQGSAARTGDIRVCRCHGRHLLTKLKMETRKEEENGHP